MNSDLRRYFYLWLLLAGSLIGTFIGQFQRGLKVETDLLQLLPETEQDAVVSHALDQFTRNLVRRHLFLIEHDDFQQATKAAANLNSALEQSAAFSEVTGRIEAEQERAFYTYYFPKRLQMLPLNDIVQLEQDNGVSLAQKARQTLYSPMSSAVANILEDDPLLTFPLYLQSLPAPPGALAVKDGWLHGEKDGKHYILLTALSAKTIFSEARKDIIQFVDHWQTSMPSLVPTSQLYVFGMSRYTEHGEQQARNETSLIGGFSIAGVILLFLFIFRSPVPMLVGLLPIAFGLLAALALSFAVFDSIHAITLGFGASLIGVCIDYTFHYYCDLWTHPPEEGGPLRHIFPAITFGALTSLLGYCALFVAPFPGLRQMAFFSTAGLTGAYLTVILAFPYLLRRQPKGAYHLGKAVAFLKFWKYNCRRESVILLLILWTMASIFGLYKLQPNDDVRALQSPPETLRQEEEKIRDVAGNLDTSRFLLVEGQTQQQLLEHLAATETKLNELTQQGALDFHQSLAPFLPSHAQQQRATQALTAALQQPAGPLPSYLAEMGFDDQAIAQLKATLESYVPPKVDAWLSDPVSSGLRYLWIGPTERGYAAMIVLGGINDVPALQALEANTPYLNYIDKVADITDLMQRYRGIAIELILVAYFIIFLLCCWRYGWRKAIAIVLPPILAAIFVLGSFGLFGYSYSLFHILALLLVMGIGIDYTIFFAEAGKPKPATMLAITLSATTTILSFGLLGLSGTALLSGFGITVWLGIVWAFILAPIAAQEEQPT